MIIGGLLINGGFRTPKTPKKLRFLTWISFVRKPSFSKETLGQSIETRWGLSTGYQCLPMEGFTHTNCSLHPRAVMVASVHDRKSKVGNIQSPGVYFYLSLRLRSSVTIMLHRQPLALSTKIPHRPSQFDPFLPFPGRLVAANSASEGGSWSLAEGIIQ